MIMKAVVIWWALTMIVLIWRSLNKKDKTFGISITKSISVAAFISGLILAAIMLLNNISGV